MRLWKWFRARRGWVQALLAVLILPIAALLLYVAGRSLQYGAVERDPGRYVPAGANVVLRARNLEAQLARIQQTPAWRTFQSKILKDAVLRRQINGLLEANGAPTLDDLEDQRKPYARYQDRALHAVGDDLLAALQVRNQLSTAAFCAVVRLRWLHYLATPFARFVLPTETLDGDRVLVLRDGPTEIRVAFVGSLAIVCSDKALLTQALRREGREVPGERPLAVRVTFEGSPGLLAVRKSIQDSGLASYVQWGTARGMSATLDVQDATVRVEAMLDRAQPLHPGSGPPPVGSWAPLPTTGMVLTSTGGADLIAWLEGLVQPTGARDPASQAIRQALQTLSEAGLRSDLLPLLQDGMGFVTGVEEREGRSYTAFVMILPSRDAAGAVEALSRMVRKIAGSWGDSKYFVSIPVGDVTMCSWSWPASLQVNDLLSPTYAAVGDRLVIGNNATFTEAVVRAAAQGAGFEETFQFRKFRSRLKEEGIGLEPTLAGGFFFPPLLRSSLDGIIAQVAKQMVYGSLNGPQLRAEVILRLGTRNGPPPEADINRAYNEAIDRRIDDQETALRRNLDPMNVLKWAAFEARAAGEGITIRAALEFK